MTCRERLKLCWELLVAFLATSFRMVLRPTRSGFYWKLNSTAGLSWDVEVSGMFWPLIWWISVGFRPPGAVATAIRADSTLIRHLLALPGSDSTRFRHYFGIPVVYLTLQ